MSIFVLPPREHFPTELTRTVGGQPFVASSDSATHSLLKQALVELKMVSLQLALMNDTALNTGDSL